MIVNVGSLDRVIRIILGFALISMVFVGPQTPWGWVGALLVVTAVIKFCPIYGALRLSTHKESESSSPEQG